MWRGGCRSDISVSAPFVWRCLSGSTVTPFPHPAHRTGHADLLHPALGQDLTPFLVYMLPPLPRRSVWAYCFRSVTQPYQPSPKGLSGRPAHRPFRGLLSVHSRYGLHTRAVTVYRDTLTRGFSHFVTSMTAPVASGWSGCRVGLAPTGKRRLSTAHTHIGHRECLKSIGY